MGEAKASLPNILQTYQQFAIILRTLLGNGVVFFFR